MYSSHRSPPPAFARPAVAHRAVARESRRWSEFASHGGQLTMADYLLRKENTRRCEHAMAVSSTLMAVSSTLSGSGSDLGDQLGLAESTNSKKEDGYSMGSCLPHRVALVDLPTSTRGALQLVPETMGFM